MKSKKTILFALFIIAAFVFPAMKIISKSSQPKQPAYEAYLFTYFTGNRPEQEQLRFAISSDGYNYTPLNNGKPVVNLENIARWKGIRDPHILRGEDGKTFYMVATDMRSSEGWSSNDGIVMLKSTDLVNWNATAIDFPTVFPHLFTREGLRRVWAPQTIYDDEAGKYMVYYSLEYTGQHLTIFYSYANEDFTELTEPQVLVDYGESIIDADIVKHNDTYHMVLAGIWKVKSPHLKGPWSELDKTNRLQQTIKVAEGPSLFKLNDSDDWILMYDCYMDGHYQFCRSSDLEQFEFVTETKKQGSFTPRHGTVIGITKEELNRLIKSFPSHNIQIENKNHTSSVFDAANVYGATESIA